MSNAIYNYISFLATECEVYCEQVDAPFADYHWKDKRNNGCVVIFFDSEVDFFHMPFSKFRDIVTKHLGVSESISLLYVKYWCKNEIYKSYDKTNCN